MAGATVSWPEFNSTWAQLNRQVYNATDQIRKAKTKGLDRFTNAELLALAQADGKTQSDVDDLVSAATDLNEYSELFYGLGTLAVAKDYSTGFAERLLGTGPY